MSNAATPATFRVTVEGGLDQLRDLRGTVERSNIDRSLRTDLVKKLGDALNELGKTSPKLKQVWNKLDEFIAKVGKESTGKKPKIGTATAATWTGAARRIKSVIGC